VDEKTFYAVKAKLKCRKHLTVPVRHKDANLFTGVCKCSKCGGGLMRHVQHRNGRTYPYLVCSAARQGSSDCDMVSIRYDLFEKSFLSLLADCDLVRRVLNDKTRTATTFDALKGELADVEMQVEKILHLIDSEGNRIAQYEEN